MNCPNCGLEVPENAHFCQNCGYRFDNIPQSDPIRIIISPSQPETPASLAQPPSAGVSPVIIEQPVRSTSNGLVMALTMLVTPLLIGGAGLFGYILLTTRRSQETAVAANLNTNVVVANTNVSLTAKPLPTTYEDLKNQIAPPAKSTGLIDEQFSVAPSSHRAIAFSITDPAGAKLAGGFRVKSGNPINFYVYPADAYSQYPTNGLKPVHLEQARNKILNEKLKTGDYYLVFENNDAQPVTVATELLLVSSETK